VIPYGEIHSPTAPQWQEDVHNRFNVPMIYASGDNEWTDCHRAEAKGAGLERGRPVSVSGTPIG